MRKTVFLHLIFPTPSKMTIGDVEVPLVHLHPMIIWALFHHVPNWKHLSHSLSEPHVALPHRQFQFHHGSVFVEASWWGLALVEALRSTVEIYCDFLVGQGLTIYRDFDAHSRIVCTALWSWPTITTYWKAPPLTHWRKAAVVKLVRDFCMPEAILLDYKTLMTMMRMRMRRRMIMR